MAMTIKEFVGFEFEKKKKIKKEKQNDKINSTEKKKKHETSGLSTGSKRKKAD